MIVYSRISHEKCPSILMAFVVFIAVLLISFENISAQVISNTGAAISVTTGAVVGSMDLENNSGSLGNDGTITLSGNYNNLGITGGNGFYNLKGQWTNLGTFNPGTSHVTLDGTVNQLITHGSSGETFFMLTLNNPGLITQISSPGGLLTVLNNLNIMQGTLRLGNTTSSLTVGGQAAITGTLGYDNTTTQVASIGGSLGGTGMIDMSGGALAHFLYLAGETNEIGTFITSPAGASTVNYNGTIPAQTVFPAMNYRHLVISNSGIKTLQDNSQVGLDLNVSGGTFDLGTATTSLEVFGNTSVTGTVGFNGTSQKNVNLFGNLAGPGAIDMSGGNLAHNLSLNGPSNNIGSYSSGNNSSVYYTLNNDQTVFISDDYRHLNITGTGIKTMLGDVTAKGILTMAAGSIDAGSNTLFLANPAVAGLVRTSGTIIGKFQRAAGFTASEYLYPIGSFTTYNPLKITFNQLSTGTLAAQYRQEDIGTTAGLPLDDDGNEIWEKFTTGYWSMTSVSPMATGSFSVNLNYDGFTGVDLSSSIIKRTNGGNLELDGVHGAVTGSEITRTVLVNGITTTDLAIGRGRPRIVNQPVNKDLCETFNTFFELRARGRGALTYQWEVSTGGFFFMPITNGGVYSGATTDRLDITAAPYSMNGYLYRCIITDSQGHPNISNIVLLTVNKIPVAVATPVSQDVCPGVPMAPIVLTTANNVPGTTFVWSRNNPVGIQSGMSSTGSGDQITGSLNNTTDAPLTVEFTILPTGPTTTFCVGEPIIAYVTVNPTPKVIAIPALVTQCDSSETSIRLYSPSTFTTGVVKFRYTVTQTGPVTGYSTPLAGLPNDHFIEDVLVNQTDAYQTVTYRVVPMSPAGCVDGNAINIPVTVNPTPRAVPVNSLPSICFGGTTQIRLESPTLMTSGSIIFDYTVSLSAPGIIIGNTTARTGLSEFSNINYSYTNSSDTIQSVYYTITPRNNAICPAGPQFISEVKVHAIPLQAVNIIKPLTCDSGTGLGEIEAIPSKGAGPYQITWHGPDNYQMIDSFVIRDLLSGGYYPTVTDNLGCEEDGAAFLVPVYAEPYNFARPLQPSLGNFNLSCAGATDGTITFGVERGITPPYRYWFVKNNVDTLESGVFVTDGIYRDIANLGAGSYKLIIRDVNDCMRTLTRTLRIPPPITPSIGVSKYGNFNVSCKGYNDGAAWVENITGGWGYYQYRWYTYDGIISGPANTNRIENIPAGRYYLEVRDTVSVMNNDTTICPRIFFIDIEEPDGMELAAFHLSESPDGNFNISCNGGNTGGIGIEISGGSGNYVYNWTSPNGFTASTDSISGLKAGDYSCIVWDVVNATCILTPVPMFTLTEPAPIDITAVTSVSADGGYEINCNGGTGSVDITVTGGSTGNYTYTWSTANGWGIVQGQEDQSALTAGTYHVEVKDLNGCTKATDITLDEPPVFALELSATHITCAAPAFDNGSINLSVTGGAGAYSYSWSNGASSEDISGLNEGLYQVNVTYNNTCSKSDGTRVNLPPALTFTSTIRSFSSYEISCNGQADGQISIAPTTGLAPFSYSWTGPNGFTSTSTNLTGLRAGDYNLQIVDANYCRVNETITLREPGPIGISFSLSNSITGGFNMNCAGDSTGTIIVNPINSVNNVEYLWLDGFTGRTRSNLRAGDYTVAITDDNGCQSLATATLREPDSIRLVFNIHKPFCPDMSDGEIRLTATGGVVGTDYEYRWSNGESGNNVSDILRGLFSVEVEDLNGCIITDSVYVEPVNSSCLRIPNIISPNNDLINDVWNIGLTELYPQMEIRIFNRWGGTVWRSEIGYPKPWDGTSNGADLPVDSYHYIIDLHNGSRPIVGNITLVK